MNDENKKILALFDFDGTITTKDTLLEFVKFAVGKVRFYTGLVLLGPWLAGFFTGLIPAHRMKEILMSHFFKNRDAEEFSKLGSAFANGKLTGLVKPSALERIAWHQQRDHEVVVVSASFSHWLAPWCNHYNVDLVASELEVSGNRITGKLALPNCNGPEKARRIKERFHLEAYDYIYAYGNSRGDKAMLELADESYLNRFE
jgi:HAD superfamily hydrolase (TIGR01490 family)